jgi:hypothetical protein
MEKLCIKCNFIKPIEEFSKHCRRKDGHSSQCKECQKKYNKKYYVKNDVGLKRAASQYRGDNRESINKQRRGYQKSKIGSELIKARNAARKEKYPEKIKAMDYVKNALKRGRIERRPCRICKATKTMHAHHDDYSKPLDVEWLCQTDHIFWHKLLNEWEAQKESGRWDKQYLSIVG